MKLDFHDLQAPEIRRPAIQLPALITDLDLDVAAQPFPCLGTVVDVQPKHQPQERLGGIMRGQILMQKPGTRQW